MEFADRRTESIPSLLQDVIAHLVGSQVVTVKPDACVIDFYNEVANYINFLRCCKIFALCFAFLLLLPLFAG